MLRLSRIFKNYNETGSLSELINLYGFIGPHVFLTKSGEVGIILEVRGVDYECLDDASIDGFTKRLESALKLFDENYRVYQYLFKRNNETIPYKLYANPIVDTAIKNRIAYLASKADTLFSLSVYYVVLYQGFQTSAKLGSALAEFPKNPKKAVADLRAHFSGQKQVVVLGQHVSNAPRRRCFKKPAALSSKSATSSLFGCSTNRKPSAFSKERSTSIPTNSISPSSSTTPSSTTTFPNLPWNAIAGICAWTTTTSRS